MPSQLSIITPDISAAPAAPIISEEGIQLRDQLLACVTPIKTIDGITSRDYAIKVAGSIKGHITQIEKDRKAVKDPFFRMGQKIDEAAAEHIKSLESELKRVNNLIGAYNAEEQRRAAAEEAARQREIARLEAERQKAIQDAADAARRAEEAAAKTGKAAQKAVAASMSDEFDAEEKAAEASENLKRIEYDRQNAILVAQQAKPTGGAQKTETDIVVTDIHALYRAHPTFVRMEEDKAAIKFHINTMEAKNDGKPIEIPGIRYTKRAVFSARGR